MGEKKDELATITLVIISLVVGMIIGTVYLVFTLEPETCTNQENTIQDLEKQLELSKDNINYAMEAMKEQQRKEKEITEAGQYLFGGYIDCYWAYVCQTDPNYCENETEFTTETIKLLKGSCEYSQESFEKGMKYFDSGGN